MPLPLPQMRATCQSWRRLSLRIAAIDSIPETHSHSSKLL